MARQGTIHTSDAVETFDRRFKVVVQVGEQVSMKLVGGRGFDQGKE
jgi:hypothetical protein